MDVPDKIVRFIQREKVLGLATLGKDGRLWSCNCFYAYHPAKNGLIIKSESGTTHIRNCLANPQVAGSIYRTGKLLSDIRGVQFRGILHELGMSELNEAREIYYQKLPIGKIVEAPFWIIELSCIKMTDNSFGIGEKIIWNAGKSV